MASTDTIFSEKVITRIWKSCSISGMVICFSWVLIAFSGIPYEGETPLEFTQGFVVDSTGNIYIHTGIYSKVLVYNKDGEFQHSWPADADGNLDIEITPEQNILITSQKGSYQVCYNRSGKELYTNKLPDDSYYENHKTTRKFVNGNTSYKLEGSFIPRLVETSSPTQKVLVRQKWYFYILNFYVGFLLIVCGGGIYFYTKKGPIGTNLN